MNCPLKVLAETTSCNYPEIKMWNLGAPEQAALHEFKHELLAAGYRLYGKVSVAKAALVLNKAFIDLAAALTAPDVDTRCPLKTLAETTNCNYPEIKRLNLSAMDQAALHAFKHEFLAAGYRLYGKVAPAKAALVLNKAFVGLAAALTRRGTVEKIAA
jgi:hypothetical protein